jgi:hypothetical protein
MQYAGSEAVIRLPQFTCRKEVWQRQIIIPKKKFHEESNMKVSELKDELLDYWVAKANDVTEVHVVDGRCLINHIHWKPSLDWSQGGPIIQKEGINLSHSLEAGSEPCTAYMRSGRHRHKGLTPLIAAMRCYVDFKFGEEVTD